MKKVAYSISTYTNSSEVTKKTIRCIENIRQNHPDASVICTNHLPGSPNLIELCDGYLYDSVNILTRHSFFNLAWQYCGGFKATIKLDKTDNNIYHGPAVHQNIYNGVLISKSMGVDYVVCTNFDTYFTPNEFQKIKDAIKYLEDENKSAFFLHEKLDEGDVLKTVVFVTNPDFYLNHFKNVRTESDYRDLQLECGSPTNTLENIYFHTLEHHLDECLIVHENEATFFNESDSFSDSQAEFYAVLPIFGTHGQNHNAGVYCNFPNKSDNRTIDYIVYEDGLVILRGEFVVHCNMWHLNTFYMNDHSYYDIIFNIKGEETTKVKTLKYKGFDEIKECGELLIF